MSPLDLVLVGLGSTLGGRSVGYFAKHGSTRDDLLPAWCGPVRVEARSQGRPPRGDLCEVVHSPFGVRAIVADVTGRGPAALLHAAEVRKAFRELAVHETGLAGIAFRIDNVLSRLGREDGGERFVTATLVQISTDGTTAELVCCGHPAPLLVGPGGLVESCEPEVALPLGLAELDADTGWYAPSWVPLGGWDGLLLHTDGLLTATDRRGRPYPLVERVPSLYRADPADFIDRICADLRQFTGGAFRDEVAILYLRPEPVPAADSTPQPARIPDLGPDWADWAD